MNCSGCGVHLEPNEEQVNQAVDQILRTSLRHAEKQGGVCPLCGHSKELPYSHRRSVQFILLAAGILVATAMALGFQQWRQTERKAVAREVIARLSANDDVARLLGRPITLAPGLQGSVQQDETGWKESRLTVPIHGPLGEATAHVVGGKGEGPWSFSTLVVDFEKQHKRIDFVSGRITEYDPAGYVDVHTEAAKAPDFINAVAAPPTRDPNFPCVFSTLGTDSTNPQLGSCPIPLLPAGPVHRTEADLRYGRFVLRETDLFVHDVFDVPLTRTYVSREWTHSNPVHAFGRNANHPFDIAPLGTRNPYTYQMIALEDGDDIYFDRVSEGTGYSDAVYQHTETASRFYKAIQSWNGQGWTTKLADGSEIHFPESYNAKSMAQGAPTEILDPKGTRLDLRRDRQRNLSEILTPHGHWIKFSYDDLGRIIRAEDDAGNWVRYGYNSRGLLEDVHLSSGNSRHYEYSGILMTQIIDESGRVLLKNYYEKSLLVRQEFPDNRNFSYVYKWSRSGRYVEEADVSGQLEHHQTVNTTASVPGWIRKLK